VCIGSQVEHQYQYTRTITQTLTHTYVEHKARARSHNNNLPFHSAAFDFLGKFTIFAFHCS